MEVSRGVGEDRADEVGWLLLWDGFELGVYTGDLALEVGHEQIVVGMYMAGFQGRIVQELGLFGFSGGSVGRWKGQWQALVVQHNSRYGSEMLYLGMGKTEMAYALTWLRHGDSTSAAYHG